MVGRGAIACVRPKPPSRSERPVRLDTAEALAIDQEGHLLERLADGDRRALLRVTRIATNRLRRLGAFDLRDEWDDLCQEVAWAMVKAVREGRAPAPDKVVSYVSAATHNLFVSRLRRRDTKPLDASESFDEDEAEWPDASGAITASDEPSNEDRLSARGAIAEMPDDMGRLLVARYVEGLSLEELVDATGRSRASVNRDLKRARERFRRTISRE